MIFHKVCIIMLAFLIVAIPVNSSNSERKEERKKPKKLSQNLKDYIEQISKTTNSKPQKVKPELKQLINPQATVQENENHALQIVINDLKPQKHSDLNQSTYILKKEAEGITNSSGKPEKRETSAAEENFKRESEYHPSKPSSLSHYPPRYGTSGANSHVMPGVFNVPNNITGTTNLHGPLNSGRVPESVNRPNNVWAPSLGRPGSPNHPSNSKPTIGATTTTTNTTKTTTEISVFIRNATLKDKTEGKILIPETNHNPDRVFPVDDKRPLPPTPEDKVRGDLCQYCLCSSDMSTVHCIGDTNKRSKILEKNQMPNGVETLVLRDFDFLEVDPQVFTSSNTLKDITFMDIKELNLKKESLFFVSKSRRNMKVAIRFNNCHFKQLPTDAITQNVDGRHENRNFFSGETRRYLSVEFVNCTIGHMQTNSMHRALLYNFYMAKTKIIKMSPTSIDLDVKTLAKFEGNDMPSLPTEAICLHSGTVVFLSNRIHSMYNRSIIVEAKSKVSFNGNMFEELHTEALAGIEASTNIYGPSIVFRNNILKRIGSKSFYFGGPFSASSQTLLNNTFYTVCSCYIEKEFESFTGTTLHRSPSLKIVFRTSNCIENVSSTFMLIDDFLSKECSPFPVVTVSAVSVAGILFIIAVTVCIVCSLRVQQVKEEANMLGECTSQSFSTLSRNYTDTLGQHCNDTVPPSPFALVPWGLAFPEVKTYQQNQIQEFTEQTESISGSTRDSLMVHRSDPVVRNPDRASCPFN